jgi:ABC-type nickel/cobalt efflux system permease component RcnA
MLLRCATMATGVMMTGVAFAAGLGLGVAAVGGACLARRAMKQRSQWRDEDRAMAPDAPMQRDDLGVSDAMPG